MHLFKTKPSMKTLLNTEKKKVTTSGRNDASSVAVVISIRKLKNERALGFIKNIKPSSGKDKQRFYPSGSLQDENRNFPYLEGLH